jgi:hypothetical protein
MHIITGVEPQGRSIKKQDGLNLTQPFVFLLWVCIIASAWVQHGEIWLDERATSTRF